MDESHHFYLDTPVSLLAEQGVMDRTALRACLAAKPPLTTAGEIASHLQEHGNFAGVPGCRRSGKIAEVLTLIANSVIPTPTPTEEKPQVRQRRRASKLSENANFDFLTDEQRDDILEFREVNGYLPMFRVLRYYLNRPDASRGEKAICYGWRLNNDGAECRSLAEIATHVDLSRERIRQILMNFSFPEELALPRLWSPYADHKTYFADKTSPAYIRVAKLEVPELPFNTYAEILQRTTMLRNIDGKFLARQGWIGEISAWHDRLSRLLAMPRYNDSRISVEGLAMGGSLDVRIGLVVLHQIAPALGIATEAPDNLVLPRNCLDSPTSGATL